jgi:hypothetical protein
MQIFGELRTFSNEFICVACASFDRLRSQLMSLLKFPDAGESFDRLCDNDYQLAEQLLRLGLVAMISSRMILLAQKELMKHGVIPTPTDF